MDIIMLIKGVVNDMKQSIENYVSQNSYTKQETEELIDSKIASTLEELNKNIKKEEG